MGTCVSNHEELLKELKKYDNNKLILEHLKQNQENFLALTKSLNQIANVNRSEPNLALTSQNSSSPHCQRHDICCSRNHEPTIDNPNTHHKRHQRNKSLLLVSLNNRDLPYLDSKKLIKQINHLSDATEESSRTDENLSTVGDSPIAVSSGSMKYKEKYLTPESIKKSHHSKKSKDHVTFGKHSKSRHLSSSPDNRQSVLTNNSSSLSTSCESIHSSTKVYNKPCYDRSVISEHKTKSRSKHAGYLNSNDMNSLHNYGIFCERPNCTKCRYAMKLLEHKNRTPSVYGHSSHMSYRGNL